MSNEQNFSTPMDDDQNPPCEAPMQVDGAIVATQPQIHYSSSSNDEQNKRESTSSIWNHFERCKIDRQWIALCNYCGNELTGDDAMQGTSHLHDHLQTCNIYLDLQDEEQLRVANFVYDEEVARRKIALAVICYDLPLSIFDEHAAFRDLCVYLQPRFNVSREDLRSEVFKIYKEEKSKIKKMLSSNQSRVAISTDIWASEDQSRHYLAIKAHYIDDSWTLQSQMLRFVYVPVPDSVEGLSEVLQQCVMDWNLSNKLSTLTVDNYCTDDDIFECILDKVSPRSFILGGQLFRMRCCNHILNLIVKDGLSLISDAIENVRKSVGFWRSTSERKEKFKQTCDQLNIPYERKLVVDWKPGWISTFMMLDAAIPYREVFNHLSQGEPHYISLPSEDDWNMAKAICQRLELFYGVAELFSGTMCPPSNVYFLIVCEVRLAMREWLSCPDVVIHQMASSMIAKFDKYWSVINEVMAVAAVLDPRYKIKLLNYFFPRIYGENAHHEIEKVKTVCQNLFTEYKNKSNENKASSSSSRVTLAHTSSASRKRDWMSEFAMYVREQSANLNIKSELELYLEEPVLLLEEEFDILSWWKINGLIYPTLQRIARDFLAIPISSVASKSTFSTSDRFLSPQRGMLRPDTVEALMCAKDWLPVPPDMQGSSDEDF